ncbi:MAG: Crp/Fnr family transcriptional regulator [Bacteroidetes bacterium]|nr:MAG: Crp/Fnr family transcriptional regulator [Bacteroidota bacterium]
MQYLNPYIELCLEGNSSVFKGLNQKEKETIAEHHSFVLFKKGELLFKEGEKSRGLVCLASGKVKVFKHGVGDREQILRMVRQQGYIGYKMLFSDNPWTVSAAAIEDSAICILERNTLVKVLRKNADLSLKFIKLISEELSFSNMRTLSLTQKHVRGRLAESLLMLRDIYGLEADGKTLRVTLSREDIAHLSNMTTSNAIRTLSNLASEGIIGLERRRISILEDVDLEHISELG